MTHTTNSVKVVPFTFASSKNAAAYGNITEEETCLCGATKRTDINGRHLGKGNWTKPGDWVIAERLSEDFGPRDAHLVFAVVSEPRNLGAADQTYSIAYIYTDNHGNQTVVGRATILDGCVDVACDFSQGGEPVFGRLRATALLLTHTSNDNSRVPKHSRILVSVDPDEKSKYRHRLRFSLCVVHPEDLGTPEELDIQCGCEFCSHKRVSDKRASEDALAWLHGG